MRDCPDYIIDVFKYLNTKIVEEEEDISSIIDNEISFTKKFTIKLERYCNEYL
jgi:hypothetical protein